MPFPALLLILATLLPLASCLVLVAIGRRLGSPLAGYVATFSIAASFLCSGWGMLRWVGGGNYHGQPYGTRIAAINLTWPAIPIGTAATPHGFEQDHPGWLDFSVYLDSLTLSLFVTVTLAAMLVHLFAIRSLRRDPRFARFFTCLSLVCFATLAVIVSGGLLQMILFLELVGFAASLLAGFRGADDPAARAAGKLFVVNRVADAGLFLGTGILFSYVGNLSFPELWLMLGTAAGGGTVMLPNGAVFPTAALTVAGVAIFFGAAARCAQFPLHVWAGDVAEAVATAGATIFGFAVAVSGLYLIARLFPLFTPSARLLIAIVGVTTLTMAALIAAVQPDVKKTLAFAATAQLGLMVLGIGVGSWVGAMFHLVAGVFIQVLLFLAAGAVIRGARGETQLSQFGGLFARMPVTALAAGVAVLAVCGVGWRGIGLSGYFSRSLILRHVAAYASLATGAHRSPAYSWLFFLSMFAMLVLAFAMSRWWMLVFAGAPRDRRLHDHAREIPTLLWPLVVLAIMTALAGEWLGIRDMLESSIIESRKTVQNQAEASQYNRPAASRTFDEVWPGGELGDDPETRPDTGGAPPAMTAAALAEGASRNSRWDWPATAIGMLAGLLLYFRGNGLAGRLSRVPPLSWLHAWLVNRMFFDELYESLFVVPVLGAARWVAWFDRNAVDRLAQLPARLFHHRSSAEGLSAARKSRPLPPSPAGRGPG
jgi:NADH:ubiquinone oxidoreductase subunit 5 (subunit L)/multisubunit Na+/H+ antiporter MnhA subunit